MIAYEELAAALERWRIRNGLPGTPPLFADGPRKAPAVVYAPPVQSYAPPPVQSYAPPPVQAPAPRPAPPFAPTPSAETIDEDLDVLDEEHLDNDGPDFVVGFNAAAPARQPAMPGMSDDDVQEASQIGGTDPGIVLPPADDAWPEAASFQSSDATAAAQYGWGNQPGPGPGPAPKPLAAIVDDDEDDDGGTLVNG